MSTQGHFPDPGRCEQGCDNAATQVIVSYNGWLIDVCDRHARELCDPLAGMP